MPEIHLHPKQALAFNSPAGEILYGGAAGGGKSFLLRVKASALALQYAGIQIYLFRRHYADLVKNHLDGPGGFRQMLQPYLQEKFCKITSSPPAVRFKNGSAIHLCHCRFDHDVFRYQGAEIHALMMDELTHFSEPVYRWLRARCRMPQAMAEKQTQALPLILCGANPGGPGHHWVKAAFIDLAEPYAIRRMPKSEGGMLRQYIPAKLEDNPSLNREEYESKLAGLKSPALVRAMLDGSWDIVSGGMWDDVWNPEIHVIEPFPIPESWSMDRSFDWGFSKPYSVGIWAESDGSDVRLSSGETLHTVRGDLFRVAEIYGWNGHPDEGARQTPREVAAILRDTLQRNGWTNRVMPGAADNSIFDSSGGPSVASEMERAGIRWLRSDKSPGSRKAGWLLLRQMLMNASAGERPSLRIFSGCVHFIRTVPVLERSERDPDDVNTTAEDHIADETRYRLLGRKVRTHSGGLPF